ncbi:MAG: hypothetical protein FGM24_11175 [Candidatus Kapabacteria bacterium]|nr:hypothetical protein [Candidatus Kapabacteria bacterium]
MRTIIVHLAAFALVCTMPLIADNDTLEAKRAIMKEYFRELPAGIDTLPWEEFAKYVDDYTYPLTAGDMRARADSEHGLKKGRIGITVSYQRHAWVIKHVEYGAPSYYAGLQVGDIIDAVNDVPTDYQRIKQPVPEIRGEVGTMVVLDIRRGDTCLRIPIQRGTFVVEQIDVSVVGRTMMVFIDEFGDDLAEDFRRLTRRIDPATIDTILFDLRGNLGGHVDETQELLGEFLVGLDTIMTWVYRTRTKHDIAWNTGRWSDPRIRLVVLQNDRSASASELFAATLRAHRDAAIIGTRSFGKGRVQQVSYLSLEHVLGGIDDVADSVIVGTTVTIAIYLAGGKIAVDSIGLEPDVALPWVHSDSVRLRHVSYNAVDVAALRRMYPLPTPGLLDSLAKAGFPNIVHHVWTDRGRTYDALAVMAGLNKQLPDPFWLCTVNHDSVPTQFSADEEKRIRIILRSRYATRLSDSVLRLEPLERVFDHLGKGAVIRRGADAAVMADERLTMSNDLGISIAATPRGIIVTGVVNQSSAYLAGVCIGDRIEKINGRPMAATIADARVQLLQQRQRDGRVRLDIRRGTQPTTVYLTGEMRNTTDVITYYDGELGYIDMTRFGWTSTHAYTIWRAMAALRDSGAKGLVFDLRGSQGGSVDVAAEVLRHFASDHDTLLSVRRRGGTHRTIQAHARGDYQNMPAYVLIDSATADAAEAFAYRMQRNGYGLVIGGTSAGRMMDIEQLYTHRDVEVGITTAFYHADDGSSDKQPTTVKPDIAVAWPSPSADTLQRLASHAGDVLTLRTASSGADAMIDTLIHRAFGAAATVDRRYALEVAYGNRGRLRGVAPLLHRLLQRRGGITRR